MNIDEIDLESETELYNQLDIELQIYLAEFGLIPGTFMFRHEKRTGLLGKMKYPASSRQEAYQIIQEGIIDLYGLLSNNPDEEMLKLGTKYLLKILRL